MGYITCIKCNDFIDIVYSDFDEYELSEVDEDVSKILEGLESGIYKISVKDIERDSGQVGEYGGYEIAPYAVINEYSVKRISKIDRFITDSEKKQRYESKRQKAIISAQKYVGKQSNEINKYSLCKLWHNSTICLYLCEGSIHKPIIDFKLRDPNLKQIKDIKKKCKEYFDNIIQTSN